MFKPFQVLFRVLALNILCAPAYSHSCSSFADFCSTINYYQGTIEPVKLVIKGIKVADFAHGMQVRIIDTIMGQPQNDTVMVWGDSGGLYRWPNSQFSTSDTVIFALPYTDGAGGSIEKPTDYMICACGVFYLSCKNDTVTGNGIPSPGQPYSVFRNSLLNCVTGIHEPAHDHSVSIFPNVSSGRFELNLEGFHQAGISLYNSLGQQVWQANSNSLPIPIDLSGQGQGVYFIRVESEERLLGTKKVMVQ